jgi:hypothetical protein
VQWKCSQWMRSEIPSEPISLTPLTNRPMRLLNYIDSRQSTNAL